MKKNSLDTTRRLPGHQEVLIRWHKWLCIQQVITHWDIAIYWLRNTPQLYLIGGIIKREIDITGDNAAFIFTRHFFLLYRLSLISLSEATFLEPRLSPRDCERSSQS